MNISRKHSFGYFSCRLGLLLASVVPLGGCGPRFSCPVRPPPDHGAYTLVPPYPPSHLNFDAQDARVAIDPACSTLCIDAVEQGGQTPLSGTIDLTIDPACVGPTCVLTLTNIDLTTEDFRFNGGTVSNLSTYYHNYDWGLWKNDSTFAIAPLSLTLWYKFVFEKIQFEQAFTNDDGALWGTLDRDYDNFSLAGDVAQGIHVSVCGHPVAHPPVAMLTPSGPFHADTQGIAHVTFSSEQSYDPDGDLQYRWWRIDKGMQASSEVTLPADLPIGSHSISVTEIDSRGASRTAELNVEVLP